MLTKNMEYNRKVDVILPWIVFIVLAAVGIWMVAANGKWWESAVSKEYLPNPILYYGLWCVFLIIFPFLYIFSLSSALSAMHRIVIHGLFVGVALFMLCWVIYLYHVKDVRVALIFMGLAWFTMLVLVGFLWSSQTWSRSAPTSGMALLFLIWLTLTWFLTASVRDEALADMFRAVRARRLAHKADVTEIKL